MQTSPRFHSTPHVHFSQIHASFDLGGRKLKSGIKSGAAARRESNQTANREASAPIRDRVEFSARRERFHTCSNASAVRREPPHPCTRAVAVRWQPSRSCRRSIAVRWEFLGSCPRAIAVRWEPPHSCGGGALERSEKTPPFKMRFSAGHFGAHPLSISTRKQPDFKFHLEITKPPSNGPEKSESVRSKSVSVRKDPDPLFC